LGDEVVITRQDKDVAEEKISSLAAEVATTNQWREAAE
jgi:hypothetical protein